MRKIKRECDEKESEEKDKLFEKEGEVRKAWKRSVKAMKKDSEEKVKTRKRRKKRMKRKES
jgi:uncharacterized circularly permuted ATP-grasp superfamily protein